MTGFSLFARSMRFAVFGLHHVLSAERNMRIHFVVALVALMCGAFFAVSATEWMFLILSIALVVIAEMTNTVFEYFLDLVHPTFDQQVRLMKDMMAAMVLCAAGAALCIGLIIFLPRILRMLSY